MTDKPCEHLLTWEDVSPVAQQAFSVWAHGCEYQWAQVAWSHLADACLTAYQTEGDRCRVAIRFLALAQIYLDWCARADEQEEYDDLSGWADELGIGAFRLGQLAATARIEGDNDEALRDAALSRFTHRARPEVREALLKGFGGNDGLFLSLWRINHPAPEPKPSKPAPAKPVQTTLALTAEQPSLFDELPETTEEDEEEEDADDVEEDDWAVMNCLTAEKMSGYEWITEGCPSVR